MSYPLEKMVHSIITKNNGDILFIAQNAIWIIPHAQQLIQDGKTNNNNDFNLLAYPLYEDSSCALSELSLSPNNRYLAFSTSKPEANICVLDLEQKSKPIIVLSQKTGPFFLCNWHDDKNLYISSGYTDPHASFNAILINIHTKNATPVPFISSADYYDKSVAQDNIAYHIVQESGYRYASWRDYQGGLAGRLWINSTSINTTNNENKDFVWDNVCPESWKQLLPHIQHNIMRPMLFNEPNTQKLRIMFLCDHEGVGNIYSCDLNGENVQQHSFEADYYVMHARWCSIHQAFFYVCQGRLFYKTYDNNQAAITCNIQTLWTNPQEATVYTTVKCGHFALSNDGNTLATVSRSQIALLNTKTDEVMLIKNDTNRDNKVMFIEYEVKKEPETSTELAEETKDEKKTIKDKKNLEERVVFIRDDGQTTLICTTNKEGGDLQVFHFQEIKHFFINDKEVSQDELKNINKTEWGLIRETRPWNQHNGIIFVNHQYDLWSLDFDTKTATLISHEAVEQNIVNIFDISYDGQWVVYSFVKALFGKNSIKIYNTLTKQISLIVHDNFDNDHPFFSQNGDYLFFLSTRGFSTYYAEIVYHLSVEDTQKLCAIPLRRDVPWIEHTQENYYCKTKDKIVKNAASDEDTEEKEANKNMEIDFDYACFNIHCFKEQEMTFYGVYAIENGLLCLVMPHDRTDESALFQIQKFDFAKQIWSVVENEAESLYLSNNKKFFAYKKQTPEAVYIHDVAKEKNHLSDVMGEKTHVSLKMLSFSRDAKQEYQHIISEVWRIQKEHFVNPTVPTLDWEGILNKYLKMVPLISSDRDLIAVINGLFGELRTSHAYIMSLAQWEERRTKKKDGFHWGGECIWDKEQKGYRITKIYTADRWKTTGGFAPSGLEIDDVLISANGISLDPQKWSLDEVLNHCLQKKPDENTTPITFEVIKKHDYRLNKNTPDTTKTDSLNKDPIADCDAMIEKLYEESCEKTLTAAKAQKITIVPSIFNKEILYRQWVEENTKYVTEKTQGRVGYIHIPNMSTGGCEEFFRAFKSQHHKDALIIDVRHNKGGNLTSLIISHLLRPRLGKNFTRVERNCSEHTFTLYQAPPKIQVAICNGGSASDGDIFSYTFSKCNLGPVIGTRTWGGVIGIWPRYTTLNGLVVAAPEFGDTLFDKTILENKGFIPDKIITVGPCVYKTDIQLDAAIAYTVEQMRMGTK